MSLNDFLSKQLIVINGFQVTVGLVILAIAVVILWQKFAK